MKALALSLVLLLALSASHSVWLQAIGDVLVERGRPAPADGVVVLAGNSRARSLKGIELVVAGYAPTLYINDDVACVPFVCVRWSDLWRRGEIGPLDARLPREAVVPLLTDRPVPLAGTDVEVAAAWQELRPRGARRLLVVTDEWHSRRAALAWRRVVRGEAEIISVPSVHERAPLANWWRNRETVKIVPQEYAKLVSYAVGGRL